MQFANYLSMEICHIIENRMKIGLQLQFDNFKMSNDVKPTSQKPVKSKTNQMANVKFRIQRFDRVRGRCRHCRLSTFRNQRQLN